MRSRLLQSLLCVAALAACDNNSVPKVGTLTLRLADAPLASVSSAVAYVSKVYLVGGSDSTGPQTVISDTAATYDLLNLQDGVTAALGSATIPVGDYSQLRLVVDSAQITLAGALQFAGGGNTKMLKIPSGMQTGVKVNFGGNIHVAPGETILVVDFDVSKSFVLTGPSDAPTGALFKPVLHATVMDDAASIAGTVTPASSHALLVAVSAANDTVSTAAADTITGDYKLWFVPPGTYTVTANGTGLNVSKSVTVRAGQDTTGVNFP